MAQKYAGLIHWADTMLMGPDAADAAYRAKHGKSFDRGHEPVDETKYPKAVPGGYTITPQHALGADGKADRTWLHPDLPGPKGNRVNKDYDSNQPGVQGSGDPKLYRPAPIIDTTQAANTPIVTRTRDEEYKSLLGQYGFTEEQVKASAIKGGKVGEAYRNGDPLTELPAYIRPGSQEWNARADMQIWRANNKEAAKRLDARTARREQRISAAEDREYERAGWTTGNPENKIDKEDANRTLREANNGWTNGPIGSRVTFEKDPTETWKNITGSTQILDYQTKAENVDLVKATQKGIQQTRQNRDYPQISGEKANVGGEMYDIQESAIIDIMDQNPGATRGQAIDMIQKGTMPPRGDKTISRVGQRGEDTPDQMLDAVAEREGMQRNQAIDMPRSEEPMAHLEMGKHFTDPSKNRIASMMPLQRAASQQATFTGTRDEQGMQPPSGLNDAYPVKSPLRYEQGNIARRSDNDLQLVDDNTLANDFAWQATKAIGEQLFGQGYRPSRDRPLA